MSTVHFNATIFLETTKSWMLPLSAFMFLCVYPIALLCLPFFLSLNSGTSSAEECCQQKYSMRCTKLSMSQCMLERIVSAVYSVVRALLALMPRNWVTAALGVVAVAVLIGIDVSSTTQAFSATCLVAIAVAARLVSKRCEVFAPVANDHVIQVRGHESVSNVRSNVVDAFEGSDHHFESMPKCNLCSGSGLRGLFGPSGLGIVSHPCPKCNGDGFKALQVSIPDTTFLGSSVGNARSLQLVAMAKDVLLPQPMGAIVRRTTDFIIHSISLPGIDGVVMPRSCISFELRGYSAAVVYDFLRDKASSASWQRDVASVTDFTALLGSEAASEVTDKNGASQGSEAMSLHLWRSTFKLPSGAKLLGVCPREILEFRACSAADSEAFLIVSSSAGTEAMDVPVSPGHHRMPLTLSALAVLPLRSGGCEVRASTHVNPGSCPAWLLEKILLSQPRAALEDLKQGLEGSAVAFGQASARQAARVCER